MSERKGQTRREAGTQSHGTHAVSRATDRNKGTLIRRALTVLAHLLVLVLAFGVVGPLRQAALAAPLLSDLIGTPTASGDAAPSLTVTSQLPPLWPGFHGTFQARVSSPADASGPVRILRIAVHVGDASPACTAANLSIPSYTWTPAASTYTVQPGQTVSVPMSLTMPDTGANQNACQGASFPIQFRLTAAPI
jgi:hypothetical protein